MQNVVNVKKTLFQNKKIIDYVIIVLVLHVPTKILSDLGNLIY